MGFHLDSISAGYGSVEILRHVSVQLEPGELVALIGPNGAGKSTLLRVASGIIAPYSGAVVLDDERLDRLTIEQIARRGIAHVPEGRRLFPGLSVRENLLLGGWRIHNQDLGDAVDAFPKLGRRLGQTVGSMSGGEQQMCAIGRALMGRPSYLLVDEASLGLAPRVVDEIMVELSRVASAGTGVLLVEQDAGAALEVAQRAYVLEEGTITLQGAADALATDPRVRAAYLGV